MRNFFFGTLPFCIGIFCINSASAATVGPEAATEQARSERSQSENSRERDDGILSNGASAKVVRQFNEERKGGEGSRGFFEAVVPTETLKEKRIVNFEDIAAVPLPSTIFLLGGGLFALIFLRRRKSITA